MTSPIVHSTFTIERHYPVSPARVFAAFANPEIKRRWFVESHDVLEYSADFRVGGWEHTRSRFQGLPGAGPEGTEMINDTVYQDIVPDRRIVFAYTMTVAGRRISASLTSVELVSADGGTKLTQTEQAAFFEGADGPRLREDGWKGLLAALERELRRASA